MKKAVWILVFCILCAEALACAPSRIPLFSIRTREVDECVFVSWQEDVSNGSLREIVMSRAVFADGNDCDALTVSSADEKIVKQMIHQYNQERYTSFTTVVIEEMSQAEYAKHASRVNKRVCDCIMITNSTSEAGWVAYLEERDCATSPGCNIIKPWHCHLWILLVVVIGVAAVAIVPKLLKRK